MVHVSMLLTLAVRADSGALPRSGSKEGIWSKVRLGTQKGTARELGRGMGRDYKGEVEVERGEAKSSASAIQ